MAQREDRLGESYCTTGQFGRLDRPYRRNCGPTAMTNLVLTLRERRGETRRETPPEIFRAIARLGRRRAVYWNVDLFGRWGGTSDLLAGAYLRAVLRRFGLENVRVRRRARLTEKRLDAALARGSLLYLELRRHPRYGDHHLLCYGAETRVVNGRRETLLRLADGWAAEPVLLPLRGLKRAYFVEVEDGGGKRDA